MIYTQKAAYNVTIRNMEDLKTFLRDSSRRFIADPEDHMDKIMFESGKITMAERLLKTIEKSEDAEYDPSKEMENINVL
jgi:hypothetical protein